MKITEETKILAILRKYPFTQRFFNSRKMYCNICSCKKHEPLRLAAINYGYDPKEFVEDLKRFIEEYKSKSS
jgi:hypothetical protein